MVWNDSLYKTVSGIFHDERSIETVLQELDRRGIDSERVDIMMSDKTRDRYGHLAESSKLPEGASTGALTGGLLGGLLGGLTMAGSLLIPGLNLLVVGPVVGAIAGGALGSATGGLVGALVGAGIPEYEAKTYEKDLQTEGNVLVIAHVLDDEVNEVKDLFKRFGAHKTDVQRDTGVTTSNRVL